VNVAALRYVSHEVATPNETRTVIGEAVSATIIMYTFELSVQVITVITVNFYSAFL